MSNGDVDVISHSRLMFLAIFISNIYSIISYASFRRLSIRRLTNFLHFFPPPFDTEIVDQMQSDNQSDHEDGVNIEDDDEFPIMGDMDVSDNDQDMNRPRKIRR